MYINCITLFVGEKKKICTLQEKATKLPPYIENTPCVLLITIARNLYRFYFLLSFTVTILDLGRQTKAL